MASKNVTLPYLTISSVSVSGTNAYTSSVSSIQYQDVVSIQALFTGVPQGSLEVQGSLNFKTGYPQGTGGQNAGDWVSIVQTAPNTLPVTVASGSTRILINMSQLAFPWIRVVYTNSTSTGTLNTYISTKSWSA